MPAKTKKNTFKRHQKRHGMSPPDLKGSSFLRDNMHNWSLIARRSTVSLRHFVSWWRSNTYWRRSPLRHHWGLKNISVFHPPPRLWRSTGVRSNPQCYLLLRLLLSGHYLAEGCDRRFPLAGMNKCQCRTSQAVFSPSMQWWQVKFGCFLVTVFRYLRSIPI